MNKKICLLFLTIALLYSCSSDESLYLQESQKEDTNKDITINYEIEMNNFLIKSDSSFTKKNNTCRFILNNIIKD